MQLKAPTSAMNTVSCQQDNTDLILQVEHVRVVLSDIRLSVWNDLAGEPEHTATPRGKKTNKNDLVHTAGNESQMNN